MYSSSLENPQSSNSVTPNKDFTSKDGNFSDRNFSHIASKKDEDTNLIEEVPASFKSPLIGVNPVLKVHDAPADSSTPDSGKKKSNVSPENCGHFRQQQWQHSDGDIRHQLLVQRMFISHDGADHPEPRTSSPLRKIRICTVAPGMQTVTVSPSSGTLSQYSKLPEGKEKTGYQWLPHPSVLSHYAQSPKGRAHEVQETFKTPNRSHYNNPDTGTSCPMTPSLLSPASTPSYMMTPGRKFCNPFEIDHDKMHMTLFSPSMFQVTEPVTEKVSKEVKAEKESFWSVEHSALMKPVEIADAEFRLQHRYQQRIDQEQDARVQTAINRFFSNKHIVPSPWSERVEHFLPRTPGTAKSVSSQTTFSVPPDVDLFAQLDGKYLLPDYKTDPSPNGDSFGSSFIRRKLLNQLNGSDGELFGSPLLPAGTQSQNLDSPSPIKQTTPEWEKGTPNKVGSSHFSSSPICPAANEMGHYSDLDPLASPELSPVAGRMTKAVRTSGIFCSNHSEGSPRAVMQLDFSSILDDPEGHDKTETLLTDVFIPQDMDSVSKSEAPSTSIERYFLTSNASQESDDNSNNKLSTNHFQRSMLTSAFSIESTSDTVTILRQSQSSQDTGYQTASLQTTNQESTCNYNLTSQDLPPAPSSTHEAELHVFPVTFGSDLFTNIKQPHVFHTIKTDSTTDLNHKTNRSLQIDGSFLELAFDHSKEKSSSADDVAVCRKTNDTCRFRKVRTLSDMRYLKEKSSVSRDLIQSFNEEQEKTDSDHATHSSWPELNSSSFIPVACRIIRQGNPASFSEVAHVLQDFHTSLPRRSDESDNVHDAANENDVSIQSAASCLNSSLEKVVRSASNDVDMSQEVSTSFEYAANKEHHEQLLHDNDRTLQEARMLLARSEEFRKKIIQPQVLESDSLYQVISGHAECEHPLSAQSLMPLKEVNPNLESRRYRFEPGGFSSPKSSLLTSVQNKGEPREGSRLGSEIAAEILKRAGDDLAELAHLLQSDMK
ncbi:hypothetical protein BsWGS_18997 [Bradybaena similaris]